MAKRRYRSGYQSYRGRRSGKKWAAVILLALVLLAACLFIYVLRNVTYTDDGEMRLNLPAFLRRDEKESQPPAQTGADEPRTPDVHVVVDRPVEPEPEEENTDHQPEDIPYVRRLAVLEALPADGAALTAQLAQTGAEGFLWRAKDETGLVRYTSASAISTAVDKNGVDSALLTALCADTTAVAALNCFHDSYYAWGNMESAGVCQSNGYIWYDYKSYHWLDPAKEGARAYVISLAEELARLGFDELLLEECAYPMDGKLHKIDYSGNAIGKTEALALFLAELRKTLEPYGTKISLRLDPRALSGDAAYLEATGVDLVQLLPLVDAVYAETDDPAGTEAALRLLLGDEEPPALVPVTAAAPAEGNWCGPLS